LQNEKTKTEKMRAMTGQSVVLIPVMNYNAQIAFKRG
jgi:hypothetical protein